MPALYKDINNLLTNVSPSSPASDFATVLDTDAIQQSMMNLIRTSRYERLHQPNVYCGVGGQLFELMSPITRNSMVSSITTCLKNYEPRATILDVKVDTTPEQNAVTVTITYQIKTVLAPQTFSFLLTRVR